MADKEKGNRQQTFIGIWETISGAEMKNNGEPKCREMTAALNTFKTNPNTETLKAFTDKLNDFNQWWQSHGKPAGKQTKQS